MNLFDIEDAEDLSRSVHFSSRSVEWTTPDDVYAALDKEFIFDLDACASHENAKCESYFTPSDDALAKTWGGIVFCNPPYGRDLALWIRKAYDESKLGATVVLLVPARTDTAWFHDYCTKGEVRFIRGRLKFGGARFNAPFPSMVVVFRGGR